MPVSILLVWEVLDVDVFKPMHVRGNYTCVLQESGFRLHIATVQEPLKFSFLLLQLSAVHRLEWMSCKFRYFKLKFTKRSGGDHDWSYE